MQVQQVLSPNFLKTIAKKPVCHNISLRIGKTDKSSTLIFKNASEIEQHQQFITLLI